MKDFYSSMMGNTILKIDLIENGKYPVYSATAKDKYFGYVNTATVILKREDLVIPARGNSIGYVKIVKVKSSTTQTTIACKKISNKILSKFIFYFLIGNKQEIFKFDNTAIPQFTVEDANSINILFPPLPEQIQIADYLDKKCNEIDETKGTIKKEITILKESTIKT